MKTILLIIFLLLCPLLLGYGVTEIYISLKKIICKTDFTSHESAFNRFALYFPTGAIILILVSGGVNLLTIYLELSVSSAVKIFAITLIALTTLCYLFMVVSILANRLRHINAPSVSETALKSASDKKSTSVIILSVLAVLLFLTVFIYVILGKNISVSGDPTLEIVNSILCSDKPYSLDPLTGLAYSNGFPKRLTLQCLPMLYAILSKAFSVTPSVLVWQIMPAFWVFCGYCCLCRMGLILFSNKIKRLIFLSICSFLLFCTDIGSGAVGFGILHKGYAAWTVVTILLITWTVNASLRHNYSAAILACIAEPLVTSLRYMAGACLVITVAFFIINRIPFVKNKKGGHRNETV